ncbi:helix-turn-helix domain-containing protein [Ruficoccus sp. ZRK36]|uniref:IclR family transcriptional regulator n=1 Tax=Ruficoccus sp. ZRK36 TaxID=2866311 RepID=UPI001C72F56B|nr:helix-turn-helix domain-containing protein [Ruficoccus sp. ZRK36]QYY35521.1 helix-turn-helix domain-containing protein [Ruficoccus sp. ZRK36]
MSNSQTIPAVHKTVAVMKYVSERNEPVTVKELSYGLEIPPATCYRLVKTLLEHNWLREDPAGGLRIAFGLANIARSYSEIEYALHALETPLRHLADTVEMSAKITLREGHYATTALRAEPSRPNAITSPVGYRFHLAVGSAAAVLLSALSDGEIRRVIDTAQPNVWQRQSTEDVWTRIRECRSKGISHDLGQQHPSIFAISTPLQLTEDTVAAVSAVGWPDDFAGKKADTIARKLKQAVDEMHKVLGSQAPRLG